MEPDTLEASKRFTKLPPFYGVIYIRFAFSRFFSESPAVGEAKKIRKVATVVSIHVYADSDLRETTQSAIKTSRGVSKTSLRQ